MSWRGIDFDWSKVRAFLVAAEEGSFSAAARALGIAQPTLGRQIEALEQELKVTLFERDGRGITLTPSGLELLAHARKMGDAAGAFSLAAHGQSSAIEGRVSIAAAEMFAATELPPIITELRRSEPKLEIELVVSNRASDLHRREADIALRFFRPTEPDLYARKLMDVQAQLYASDAYLTQFNPPLTLDNINRAEFISLDSENVVMHGLNAHGMNLTEANFPLQVDSYVVMWNLMKSGAGVCIMDTSVGDREPGVRRVLPDFPSLNFSMWLVAHRELKTNRRVRRVFDYLVEKLAG
ncbi:LysR family transcriptional regulator [Maritalea mediterranea]|uniref:LysR family transcriptional regulator n=1 Tax=Maritalea mediterranea TaxID=2909667 RepID=A0ABS9E4K0_9HYPH|nr:LysR family transcriptional regulator [Maritalea mediterranea]MCF4097789.1 LysR family transcriptional regulator [Maritalea mediterranea]